MITDIYLISYRDPEKLPLLVQKVFWQGHRCNYNFGACFPNINNKLPQIMIANIDHMCANGELLSGFDWFYWFTKTIVKEEYKFRERELKTVLWLSKYDNNGNPE